MHYININAKMNDLEFEMNRVIEVVIALPPPRESVGRAYKNKRVSSTRIFTTEAQ